MLASEGSKTRMSANYEGNMNSITIDVVCEIEKELLESPYDMTSLVFLLYDVPDTALQRLLVHQRVSKDTYSTNLNLLHEWMQRVKTKPTWRYEFLEALLICQLYGIVRKLGFNIQHLKKQYQPDNIFYNKYINPTKKVLYKLCENIEEDNLSTLKRTLLSYKINTIEYDSCELIFLKLMSEKIIATEIQSGEKSGGYEFDFDKLIKLLQKMPGLDLFAKELRSIQRKGCNESITEQPIASSSPSSKAQPDVSMVPQVKETQKCEFEDIYELLNELNIDEHIKADSNKIIRDIYPIINQKKIGVCLIINQENFHFCDQSIEDLNLKATLSKRKGSSFDIDALHETLSAFNIEVITKVDLSHIEMIDFIKSSIKRIVRDSTSIFMLCIMSHGVRDHVFAADSMKVKVEDIQNLLDDAMNLRNIPKVMIIQACQVDDVPQKTLVADSPSNIFSPRKLDFLVYWATSPEYEAYRAEEAGSIFIQVLCKAIKKIGHQEHLDDIFTKVNNAVHNFCKVRKCLQVPYKQSSLRKKLYLQIPQ